MFFFINLDDFFDGVSSTFGLIIIALISLLFFGLPIAFFDRGGLGVILALVFGLTISIILLSLFCIKSACKTIFNKKTTPEYKKKRFSKLYLIAFLIVSLSSLLLPSNLTILSYNLTISKIIYFFAVPLIADIVYIFYIYGDFSSKKYFLEEGIWNPLKKLLTSLIIPTFIFYWIVLLLYLGANGTPKIHDFYNNIIDKTSVIFEYKNTKYTDIRQNEIPEKIIEKRINIVSTETIYHQDDLEISNSKLPELFWNDNNDIRYYTYSYIESKAKVDDYLTERGIIIKNSNIIDENTIFLEYYDLSTLKENVVKFDLKNYKITEKATYLELDTQFYENNKKRLNQ